MNNEYGLALFQIIHYWMIEILDDNVHCLIGERLCKQTRERLV